MKIKFNSIDDFRLLHAQSSLKSLLSIGLDWLIILTSIYISTINALFFLLALVLIGSRQRALSNLIHDASHVNLFTIKTTNDIIANLLCAFPMLETVKGYRSQHLLHHKYLGDSNDPDVKAHLSYGYDDSNPWKGNPVINFLRLIFNITSWKNSCIGGLDYLDRFGFFLILIYNIIVFSITSLVLSIETALYIYGIWFFSKATTFHLIRIIAEFLDHSGLENSSIFSYSRNLPHDGLLRFILHPNHDSYHIVHHLYPRIPHYNLKYAHARLLSNSLYMSGHHCDGYFFGTHPAFKCWVGRCGGGL